MPASTAEPTIASGDAELAARDRALPGLALLFDDAAFAEALAAARPGAGIAAARATYVRYKPGTSCLVGFVVTLDDGGEVLAYARAQRPRDRDKLLGNLHRADAHGPLGPGLALLHRDVSVYPFPNDRRMPALGALADPQRRRRLLERKLRDPSDLAAAPLEPLRFKPERRFVGRLEGERSRALVRLYGSGFDASLAATKALGRAAVRVPRRLVVSQRRRLIVLEWLDGETVTTALQRGDPAAAAHAGAILAALHSSPVRGLTPRRPRGAGAAVGRAVDAVAWLVPDVAEPARETLSRIRGDLEAGPGTAPIHGDFSADQCLLGADGPALLDLDEAGIGRREQDLGSFLAALELDVVRGDLARDLAARAGDALLEGYGVLRADATVRRFTAAALLRLAPEPFRHREPGWPGAVRALVARAEALADA